MQEGVGGSELGVALEQKLQPLINSYLGKPHRIDGILVARIAETITTLGAK